MYSKIYLQRKIELLRHEMTEMAILKGFSDQEVVQISQELDYYLNEYRKFEKPELSFRLK